MYQMPVYFAGCDLSQKGHVRLAAFLREMQKSACLDLKNYNLSPEILYDAGIAFVLSKTSLVIEKTHLPSAELSLLTYPRTSHGATFLRDFVFTQNNETVARATTRWGILNLETRRLVRPTALPRPIVPEEGLFVGFEPPRLSTEPLQDAQTLGTYRVSRCMTDANGHLNNAAYLDLCLNATEDIPVREMHIEYRQELLEGECVTIRRAKTQDGTMLFGTKGDDSLSFLLLTKE